MVLDSETLLQQCHGVVDEVRSSVAYKLTTDAKGLKPIHDGMYGIVGCGVCKLWQRCLLKYQFAPQPMSGLTK